MTEKLIIKIEVDDPMNTDLANWIMSARDMWNNQMPRTPMTVTWFEIGGMSKPVFDEQDMIDF